MNIIHIHQKILSFYNEENKRIEKYKNKILGLEKLLENNTRKNNQLIKSQIQRYTHYIQEHSRYSLDYYLHKTSMVIKEYNEILSTPVTVDFMTNKVKENPLKKELIERYESIIHEFPNLEKTFQSHSRNISTPKTTTSVKDEQHIICVSCKNDQHFEIVENYYICTECGRQQLTNKTMNSYNDGDRINIYTKYTYDRRNHFKDCIKQYQGTQHTKVEDYVYENLEKQFEKHHLTLGDSNTPSYQRFKNITKKHVLMFLKELKYHKHYENFVLIHYKMTGVPPDDISHLFEKLLEDFDVLTELYDKLNKENKLPVCISSDTPRKNFINTQYVLYALLCRHKHKIDHTSINMLKTKDRLFWHDKVIRVLFEHLGWNFTENFMC